MPCWIGLGCSAKASAGRALTAANDDAEEEDPLLLPVGVGLDQGEPALRANAYRSTGLDVHTSGGLEREVGVFERGARQARDAGLGFGAAEQHLGEVGD